jgi:hypothetical protein
MGSTNFLRALIVVLAPTLGCGSEEESAEITESTDCSSIADWQDQHECVYEKALMQVDDPQAMQAEISKLSDPIDQDMIFYRLAFNHPERSAVRPRREPSWRSVSRSSVVRISGPNPDPRQSTPRSQKLQRVRVTGWTSHEYSADGTPREPRLCRRSRGSASVQPSR